MNPVFVQVGHGCGAIVNNAVGQTKRSDPPTA